MGLNSIWVCESQNDFIARFNGTSISSKNVFFDDRCSASSSCATLDHYLRCFDDNHEFVKLNISQFLLGYEPKCLCLSEQKLQDWSARVSRSFRIEVIEWVEAAGSKYLIWGLGPSTHSSNRKTRNCTLGKQKPKLVQQIEKPIEELFYLKFVCPPHSLAKNTCFHPCLLKFSPAWAQARETGASDGQGCSSMVFASWVDTRFFCRFEL